MRPVLYGFGVVVLLMLAVAVYVIASHSGPNKAVGLGAVAAVTLSPTYWLVYIAGFGITYWATSR